MGFLDEYLKLRQQQQQEKRYSLVTPKKGNSFADTYLSLREQRMANDNNRQQTYASTAEPDIAPSKSTVTEDEDEGGKWYDGWFQSGALDEGVSGKSIAKAILGTARDFDENFGAGILDMGEKIVDAGASVVGAVGGLFSDEFQDKTQKFIEKDLYDGKKIASALNEKNSIIADKILGVKMESENSVLGEKSDSLAQSAGQLTVQLALTAAGLPTVAAGVTGATAFGGEAENAFREGATYGEAMGSAAITAGAEILSEKLFGAINFGGAALDDSVTRLISTGISDEIGQALVKFGVDAAGEGFEEIVSEVASNLGSALYKEESVSELLFSKEARQGYIEAFVGGSVLGGTVSGGNMAINAAGGKNAVTGLDDNAQKVMQHEYESRVKEAEDGGEKLTKKDKNKIYDEVMDDMQKGYISTDTIESVLGGESYKAYKDATDEQDALQSEYDSLADIKKSDLTTRQESRLQELTQKLDEFKQNNTRDTLKAKLSDEVMGLTRGGILAESYNQKAQRGAAFEADVSKYDTKQQAVVQKAIDSGILNNTRRTHEFVDMVAKISADKGVLFDFANNEKLKSSGFAVDGATVNGYVTKDGVTVNIDSAKSLNSVVGHEIAHVLEGTEIYTELQNSIAEYAKTKGEYDSRRASLAKLYEGVKDANIDAELTADLVGDYLFTDSDFINSLSTKNRNVFQKIYDEIKYLVKVATAGSKEARELEKVKRAFDKAYKESGKGVEGTKHSLSDSDGKTLTSEQQEYFAKSKMRDENGNLKVMYHGSQDAGFHVFDPSKSDDDISLFFVDRNDVAASYSGTSETYEAQTIRTAEDMNKFIESIGVEGYEVIEHDGKFDLIYEDDLVASRDTAQEIYKEFCWYEGVGEGDANYKVYLNLTNPLEVDAKGRPWNKIDAEFSQEVYDRYSSLTADEKAALVDLAEWEDFRLFNSEVQEASGDAVASAYAKMGEDCNIYDLFSVAADNFSEESMRENSRRYLKTRDYAQRAKEQGYDGVIFKNIHDNGGYSNGSEGASTVAIAFSSEQVKSVANGKPTGDPDIRYSRSDGKRGKVYGDYNVYGEDVRLDVAPVQDGVQVENVRQNAQTETAPVLPDDPFAEMDGGAESERLYSLDDADIPPEADAPFYGEESTAEVDDPFAERDISEVGNRKVNAYMYENPEVKPYFQAEANVLLGELRDGTKGERFYTETPDGQAGVYGAESYGVWTGVKRNVSPDIEYLLDGAKMSYADIEKGLRAIIEDHGAENIAAAKKIEFVINDRLMKGYQDWQFGSEIPPNQGYINIIEGKQFAEQSAEAFDSLMEYADMFAPPVEEEAAPVKAVKQTSEPIKPQPQTSKTETAEPVSREVFKQREGEIYKKIAGLSSGKYHKVDGYGYHLARANDGHATITINTPDGQKLQRRIDDGKYWKNERLWHEAARMVAENQYPNVEQITPEEAKKAKIITHDQKQAQKKPKRSMMMQARAHLVDDYSVFEDTAYKHKNRELYAKANFMRYSEQRAQHFIGNGADGVRAVADIRADVENSGLYDEFHDYMYDMLNTDRMSIEANAAKVTERLRGKFEGLRPEQIHAIAAKEITGKTTERTAQTIRDAREYLDASGAKNKAVFGWEYTAEMSREAAAKAEAKHPQFKKWAQEIYDNMKWLRSKLVEDGEISQETADLFAKMYPHYIPIHRVDADGNAISVPLDTNKTGVNAPIKRAVGGDGNIDDLFDTIGKRIKQTFKAGARNSFGVELMNTLGTKIEQPSVKRGVDESVEGVDQHEERLKKGENGRKPTFTVFEDGRRVEFEITEDMYDALKPKNDLLTRKIPVASHAVSAFKKLTTQYSPKFLFSNPIKDAQDVLMNSQHPVRTYANLIPAYIELGTHGKYYAEYMRNGGEQNTYFDGKTESYAKDDSAIKKLLGLPLRGINIANDFFERAPRLAEYMASRKAGASIETAMLDAANVTTNFNAGGDFTRFLNRNFVPFLNPSVQGAAQQVRNVRDAASRGFVGCLGLAVRYAAAGIPVLIFNSLMWDDDEEYAELSDYVKESYYVVAKFGDGKFVRIPKGRNLAVIQDAAQQIVNVLTGEETDWSGTGELALSNLAPNNPIKNNILSPVQQIRDNETWYGESLVPSRLQNVPDAEQYDESTDLISKWLGEKLNYSPMKINYLIDQYTGGIGDMFLPMLAPETKTGDDSLGGTLIAPWKDLFTTDSVMNNQNVSDFYDTLDEVTKAGNSMYATDEDVLSSKYLNSINADLGKLYERKRVIQNYTGMTDAQKYERVRGIQAQIDEITRESLDTYGSVNIDGGYATVGDRHYRVNKDGAWEKITDKQLEKQNEVTSSLGIKPSEYWGNKEEYDFAYEYPGKYAISKTVGGFSEWKNYNDDLNDIYADKDEDGKSISGSRKEKVLDYINGLDLDYGQRIILFRSEYSSKDDRAAYNQDILDYLNSRQDISYEDTVTILKELGFTVDGNGNVYWD